MHNDLATAGKSLAMKGIAAQLCVALIMIIITVLLMPTSIISVLFGVIAFVLPHSLFAYWLFRYAGASKNNEVARSLSQGMKLKLALTTLIFVVAFGVYQSEPLLLLGAYVMTMVSQWTAMFFLQHQ